MNLEAVFNQLGARLSRIIENFPDKCSISRPSNSVNEYGATTATYSTIASGIGCSWAPGGKLSKEQLRRLKIVGVAAYAITLPAIIDGQAIDLKPQDRIVVAARGVEPQRTFEVQGPPLRNAGLTLFVPCTLEE